MPYYSYEQFIQEGGNPKANFVPWLHAKYSKHIAELEAGIKRRDDGYRQMAAEIDQTLGRALGYPRYCDDQKNFPGATDKDGVCTGDHVPETLAMEAARRIAELESQLAEEKEKHDIDRLLLRRRTEIMNDGFDARRELERQLAASQEREKGLRVIVTHIGGCDCSDCICAELERPRCDSCDVVCDGSCQGVTGEKEKGQGCAKS